MCPEFLERAQLLEPDDVADVQVGRRRVAAELDAQRPPERELGLEQLLLVHEVDGVAPEFVDLCTDMVRLTPFGLRARSRSGAWARPIRRRAARRRAFRRVNADPETIGARAA